MSEPSDQEDYENSSSEEDAEGGLFGGMMKTMFQEKDMKKEFVYAYKVPPIHISDVNKCNEIDETKYKEIVVKLNGIHESYGQTAEKTGYTLWRAAIKLANNMVIRNMNGGLFNYFTDYILKNNARATTEHVAILELGAGLGLCGILASKLDANCTYSDEINDNNTKEYPSNIRVVITDGDTKVLDGVKGNIALNCNAPVNTTHDGQATLKTSKNTNMIALKLRWGLDYINDFVHTIPHDFVHTNESPTNSVVGHNKYFDIIMGSDIIYDEKIIPDLFDTVYSLLCNTHPGKRSIFILSYERRNVPMDLVFNTAFEKGFELIEEHDKLIQIDNLFIFTLSNAMLEKHV